LFANTFGIQYEPVAKEAFETLFYLKVLLAGLFVDDQYNFLAASPDGLVRENEIVEITCKLIRNNKSTFCPSIFKGGTARNAC
jgi:hypothetical protein